MRGGWVRLFLLLAAGSLLIAPLDLPAADPGAPDPGRHLLLLVTKDARGFAIDKAVVVQSPLPKQRDPKRIYPWRFEVVDPARRILHRSGLEDPTLLRGEFANPSDPSRIDAVFIRRTDVVTFLVRLPLLDQASRIHFLVLKPEARRQFPLPADAYREIGSADLPGQGN
jgi:hypothetical protein